MVVKRKIVAEICGVPNCKYSQEEVKGKHNVHVLRYIVIIEYLLIAAAVQRKYESVRRQWKAEDREDYLEVCRKTSLLKKYRSRRKRVRM